MALKFILQGYFSKHSNVFSIYKAKYTLARCSSELFFAEVRNKKKGPTNSIVAHRNIIFWLNSNYCECHGMTTLNTLY